MPIPENRRSIERALAEQRRKRLPGMDGKQHKLAQIDAHLAKMRDKMSPEQFAGTACVLDVFLYPLRQGGEPVATHVEARRASDGQEVDRAACAQALRR